MTTIDEDDLRAKIVDVVADLLADYDGVSLSTPDFGPGAKISHEMHEDREVMVGGPEYVDLNNSEEMYDRYGTRELPALRFVVVIPLGDVL